jgi:hypothetical protein
VLFIFDWSLTLFVMIRELNFWRLFIVLKVLDGEWDVKLLFFLLSVPLSNWPRSTCSLWVPPVRPRPLRECLLAWEKWASEVFNWSSGDFCILFVSFSWFWLLCFYELFLLDALSDPLEFLVLSHWGLFPLFLWLSILWPNRPIEVLY